MGWFDTKNKQQHVHVVANAWDMQRIEERNRRRKWFIFLDIIFSIFIIAGIGFIYIKDYLTGIILVGIGFIIFLYLILRKRRKNKTFSRRRRLNQRKRRRTRR